MIHTLANVAGPAFPYADAGLYEYQPGDVDALIAAGLLKIEAGNIQITRAGRLELRKPRGKPPRKQVVPEPLTVDALNVARVVNEATEGPKEYPEADPREEELERLRAERDAERAAREAAEKRLAELEARDAPVPLPPNPSETKLSDYGEVGEEADLEPDHLLDFMRADKSEDMADTGDIIAKLSSAKRKRFTELLNVELAELQQMRGAAGENLTRETEIEKLLGLFARVGEM